MKLRPLDVHCVLCGKRIQGITMIIANVPVGVNCGCYEDYYALRESQSKPESNSDKEVR
jgi:hypothetical protein